MSYPSCKKIIIFVTVREITGSPINKIFFSNFFFWRSISFFELPTNFSVLLLFQFFFLFITFFNSLFKSFISLSFVWISSLTLLSLCWPEEVQRQLEVCFSLVDLRLTWVLRRGGAVELHVLLSTYLVEFQINLFFRTFCNNPLVDILLICQEFFVLSIPFSWFNLFLCFCNSFLQAVFRF